MKDLAKAAISSAIVLLATAIFSTPARAGDEPKWINIHSAHFSVITDGGEKRGREVALRMEQMRAVFGQLLMKDKLRMSVPVTVIALKSDKQYGQVAPTKLSMAQGFFVPGPDRIYIVLNLFEVEPWRAIAHPLAHYLLNYNYPPAQGWFDEGLAEYFGAIRVDNRQVEIGADPELAPEWHEDIFDNVTRDPNVPQSLTQLLQSPIWLSMVDLFSMKHDTSGMREGTHHTLYYAQSWMVMHYLINKNKMPETGTYFDLVLNQKVPVDKAMVQAFDLSPSQMEEAVKTYFKSLSGLGIALDRTKAPPQELEQPDILQPYHYPTILGPDDVALSVDSLPDPEARAIVGDAMARVPEHRDQALHDLQQLVADPKDNEPAHRALAWDDIEQKKFDAASDELDKASDLNLRDPWIWYYRSVLKYRKAQATGQQVQGLANMMQDVRAVLDWYPEFADAYNMLGMARVEGGGINSALEAQRQAIALSPRNLEYQYNLGQIYVAGKKWDQARDLLTRLKTSSDPRAASAAKKQLADLDTLQKYGIRPERGGQPAAPAGAGSAPAVASNPGSTSASAAANNSPATVSSSSDDDDDAEETTAPKPAPAKTSGPVSVQFLKGKLVSSDCSKAPEATLKIVAGMKTYQFHASDFKSLLVIGADQFSCDWKNRVVAINYRPAGKNAGEVVSIEVQ
jgi:tetratricopeptide (TPR) repeat protein